MDNDFVTHHGLIPQHVAFVALRVEEKVSLWAASWANGGGLRYALRNPYAFLTQMICHMSQILTFDLLLTHGIGAITRFSHEAFV